MLERMTMTPSDEKAAFLEEYQELLKDYRSAPPLPGPPRAFWGLIPEKPMC